MKSRIEELLAGAPDPVCSAAGREAVKQRVLAALRSDETTGRREQRQQAGDRAVAQGKLPRTIKLRRAVLVPALVLTLLAAMTAGAYALSADKNPHSLFYPVKLFFERARLELTGSDLARAELELSYAEKRMAELEFMVSHNISKGAEDWAAGYETNLQKTLYYCSRLQGDSAISMNARLSELAQKHMQLLQGFSVQASLDLSPAIDEARGVCDQIRSSSKQPAGPTDTGPVDTGSVTPPLDQGNSEVSPPAGDGIEPGDSGELPGETYTLHPYDPYDPPGMHWPYTEWWKNPTWYQGNGTGPNGGF